MPFWEPRSCIPRSHPHPTRHENWKRKIQIDPRASTTYQPPSSPGLRLCNFFWNHILKFALISAPLTTMIQCIKSSNTSLKPLKSFNKLRHWFCRSGPWPTECFLQNWAISTIGSIHLGQRPCKIIAVQPHKIRLEIFPKKSRWFCNDCKPETSEEREAQEVSQTQAPPFIIKH